MPRVQISDKYFGSSAGLYIHTNTKNGKTFKCGLSTTLVNRLSSYHTCFPNGYYIRGLIVLVRYEGKFSKLPEDKKKDITKKVRAVEKQLHIILKPYQVGLKASSRSEWFGKGVTLTDISNACERAIKKIYGNNKKVHINKPNKVPCIITNLADKKYDI